MEKSQIVETYKLVAYHQLSPRKVDITFSRKDLQPLIEVEEYFLSFDEVSDIYNKVKSEAKYEYYNLDIVMKKKTFMQYLKEKCKTLSKIMKEKITTGNKKISESSSLFEEIFKEVKSMDKKDLVYITTQLLYESMGKNDESSNDSFIEMIKKQIKE